MPEDHRHSGDARGEANRCHGGAAPGQKGGVGHFGRRARALLAFNWV